jgi:dipeptidase
VCDSIVALGSETAAGVALFAKNSDRLADECQPLLQLAEAHHAPGTRLRCTHVEIPQVPHTWRVLGHSPFWVWGFEHGVNQHAVAIGNQTVFSKEPLEEEPGLIGMDLVRLGLERGRTAREALGVITALLEAHGQGGAARAPGGPGYHNAFLVADPGEAWVLETSNRRWAARRASLEALSNHLCLGDDFELASPDLEGFARAQGWWSGEGPLHLARAYRNPHVPPHLSEGRRRRARALLEAGRGRHDRASFTRLLRDHGADGVLAFDPAAATPADERYFTLCAHSEPVHWTTATLVAPLPAAREAPWPVWVGFGTPCTGILLPVYLEGVLPAALARGPEGGAEGSAWCAFQALQRAASRDPLRATPRLRAGWAALEGEIEAERARVEAAAVAAARRCGGAAAHEACEIVSDFMERSVGRALARAAELRDELAAAHDLGPGVAPTPGPG